MNYSNVKQLMRKQGANIVAQCKFFIQSRNQLYTAYHFFNTNKREVGYWIPSLDPVILTPRRKWSQQAFKSLNNWEKVK